MITLTQSDVDAIAEAVVAKLRTAPVEDPLMPAKDVCTYLGISRTTLWVWQKSEPLLAPTTQHPLRWSKRQLETFKLSKMGAVMRAVASTVPAMGSR